MTSKPKRKRLKPLLLVEAERDARNRVAKVLADVRVRYILAPGVDVEQLAAAIRRGAQAAARAVKPGMPPREALKRALLLHNYQPYSRFNAKGLSPECLRAALGEHNLRPWAIERMAKLIYPPEPDAGPHTRDTAPLTERRAARVVAVQLFGNVLDEEKIRDWWRSGRKR
jgi:hypothetical protein